MIFATLGDRDGLRIAADFCLFNFFHDVILFLGVLLPQTAKRMIYRSYLVCLHVMVQLHNPG
jgi:hypothetical protein